MSAEAPQAQPEGAPVEYEKELARLRANLNKVPRPPYEERLRKLGGGPYIIAPDSAEPIPTSIWARIDLDDLDAAVDRMNAQLERELTPVQLASAGPGGPSVDFLPKESRDLLRDIGGDEALKTLAELEVGDNDRDTHEPVMPTDA